MIGTTPSKALKPGMVVLVTNDGQRVIREDQPGAHAEMVRFACPARFGGKAGTEVTFTNGVEKVYPAGASWIVVS